MRNTYWQTGAKYSTDANGNVVAGNPATMLLCCVRISSKININLAPVPLF